MLHFISISRVFLLSATQCRLKLLCPFIFSVLRYVFFPFRRFHLCVSRVSSPSVCFCPFLRPLGLSCLPIVSPTLRLSKCLNLCSLGRVRFLCFHRWRSFVEGAEKRKYALLWRSHFRREESRYFYLSDLYSLPLTISPRIFASLRSFLRKETSQFEASTCCELREEKKEKCGRKTSTKTNFGQNALKMLQSGQ